MGPHPKPFHLENCWNPPLYGYPPRPTLHPYIGACGVDKKQSKMVGKQLAVHCRVCSLIRSCEIHNYKSIANWKPVALSLLDTLNNWITDFSICIFVRKWRVFLKLVILCWIIYITHVQSKFKWIDLKIYVKIDKMCIYL